MSDTVRVSFTVKCDRSGYNHVWWFMLGPQDLVIVGYGDNRHVLVRNDFQLRMAFDSYWNPLGPLRKILQRSGIPIDVKIAVDFPRDAIIRAGVESSGGRFYAEVHSPPLVMENGSMWEGEGRDGARWVWIQIENARPITAEEAE